MCRPVRTARSVHDSGSSAQSTARPSSSPAFLCTPCFRADVRPTFHHSARGSQLHSAEQAPLVGWLATAEATASATLLSPFDNSPQESLRSGPPAWPAPSLTRNCETTASAQVRRAAQRDKNKKLSSAPWQSVSHPSQPRPLSEVVHAVLCQADLGSGASPLTRCRELDCATITGPSRPPCTAATGCHPSITHWLQLSHRCRRSKACCLLPSGQTRASSHADSAR